LDGSKENYDSAGFAAEKKLSVLLNREVGENLRRSGRFRDELKSGSAGKSTATLPFIARKLWLSLNSD